ADTVLGPAPDIARDLAVDEDRSLHRRRVAEDICCPMGVEGSAVAGGEGGHACGVGVELVFVEDGQVRGLDVAELYVVAHFSMPGQGVFPTPLRASENPCDTKCTSRRLSQCREEGFLAGAYACVCLTDSVLPMLPDYSVTHVPGYSAPPCPSAQRPIPTQAP